MPLFDHFHRPLSAIQVWESFHTQWGSCIAADLNRRLPRRFVASSPTHLGPFAAADVGERELFLETGSEPLNGTPASSSNDEGGVAVAVEPVVYSPPDTELVMPVAFPVEYTVEIRDTDRASRVVAVIELVSPANKKEAHRREQFAGKCLSYLAKGLGLVIIDIVTERLWNLHNQLVRLAGHDLKLLMAGDPPLYVTTYRPVHRNKADVIDLWLWPLTIGAMLPGVPLALKGFGCVKLELETTYSEACERSRIP
jgi:hypothetical protein